MARRESTTIAVLGAGVGGLVVANDLHRRLGSQHRIVLIDKRTQYLYTPSFPWVAVGMRRPSQATKNLRQMVRPGIQLVQAAVQQIDAERQHVKTSTGDVGYDYLVVALGADTAPEITPGYKDVAHNFFELEGADRLRRALMRFDGGRLVVAISSLPYKCPAAPYEAALLLDDALRRRGVRDRADLQVYTPEPLPMPVAGPVVGNAIKEMLERQGIGFNPGVQLESIDGQRGELVFKDGATVGFDLLAAVPPHQPPRAVKESVLANEAGWVPVDRRTLKTRVENVYAIGDVTAVTLSNGKLLPKAGVFAHAEALTVAGTIAGQIQGTKGLEFDGVGFCWVAMSRHKAGFASGDFYAEPEPAIDLRQPGLIWHLAKVLFEQYWMGNTVQRAVAWLGLVVGSKALRIPANL